MKYLFAIILMINGCDSTSVAIEDQPKKEKIPTIPDDWIQIVPDSIFQFKAPPDLVDQEATGIDSFVEIHHGDRIIVSFDYGPFTLPSDECWTGYLACRFEETVLDGIPATVFTTQSPSRDTSYGPIIYAVSVESEGTDNTDGDRLSFQAYSYAPEDTVSLRLIAFSIDFVP